MCLKLKQFPKSSSLTVTPDYSLVQAAVVYVHLLGNSQAGGEPPRSGPGSQSEGRSVSKPSALSILSLGETSSHRLSQSL